MKSGAEPSMPAPPDGYAYASSALAGDNTNPAMPSRNGRWSSPVSSKRRGRASPAARSAYATARRSGCVLIKPVSRMASGAVTSSATACASGKPVTASITAPSTSVAIEYAQRVPGAYASGTVARRRRLFSSEIPDASMPLDTPASAYAPPGGWKKP